MLFFKLLLVFHSYYGEAINSTALYIKRRGGITDITIDNISVKEVTEATNTPRIDYTDGGCPVLLTEPQRTNEISFSNDFSSLNSVENAVVTSNQTISPSGVLDSDKITFDGTLHGRVETSTTATIGESYSVSVYLKNEDLSDVTQVWIGFSQAGQGEFVTITNDWQRYEVTIVADGTTEYPRVQFSGTGSLYAFGFQVEEGSYPTSLIPTNGSPYTRLGEVVKNENASSLMGQTEGTVFIDVISAETDTEILSFNRSSQNAFFLYTNSLNEYRVSSYLDGAIGTNTLFSANQRIKVAIAYENNSQRIYVNGVLETSFTFPWTPNDAMNRIYINQGGFVAGKGKSNISALQVFNTALTDAELIELTTI